jgi:hypothetical protein
MEALTGLSDIVRNVGSLTAIEMVKVIGTCRDAKLETIDYHESVVIFGEMYGPIDGINSTIGMGDLRLFKNIVQAPWFDPSSIKTTVVKAARNHSDYLMFETSKGDEYRYQLMSQGYVDQVVKVPPFKGATFQICAVLAQEAIDLLKYWYRTLEGYSPDRFYVAVTPKGRLMFTIGDVSDCKKLVMAEGVGTLRNRFSYPTKKVLDVLALNSTSKSLVLSISDQGVMKLDVDSGLGKYRFLFPGKN